MLYKRSHELNAPVDLALASSALVLEHERTRREAEMGIVGRLIGGGDEKAENIAVIVLLLAFVLIAIVIVLMAVSPGPHWQQVFSALVAVITGTGGYIFGRGKGARPQKPNVGSVTVDDED